MKVISMTTARRVLAVFRIRIMFAPKVIADLRPAPRGFQGNPGYSLKPSLGLHYSTSCRSFLARSCTSSTPRSKVIAISGQDASASKRSSSCLSSSGVQRLSLLLPVFTVVIICCCSLESTGFARNVPLMIFCGLSGTGIHAPTLTRVDPRARDYCAN
jgi:hypothetical protein